MASRTKKIKDTPRGRAAGGLGITIDVADDTEHELTPSEQAARDSFAIVTQMRVDVQTSQAAEDDLRVAMLDDRKFTAGKHWSDEDIALRKRKNLPCHTVNKAPVFVRHVTNQQRQNKPAIQVSPNDDHADVETAEVFQGLIRNTEYVSTAQVAYARATKDQVEMGRGWLYVTSVYKGKSFSQELLIRSPRNAFSIYPDPTSQELDYSDGRFLVRMELMPKNDYRRKYGDDAFASLTEFCATGDRSLQDWMPEGYVRLAEYWYKEIQDGKIYEIGGEEVPSNELRGFAIDKMKTMQNEWMQTIPAEQRHLPGAMPDEMNHEIDASVEAVIEAIKATATRERDWEITTIRCALCNAREIIDGNKDEKDERGHRIADNTKGRLWAGTMIPWVPVVGEETEIEGKVDRRGMIRDAKDPMRIYDYWDTKITTAIALAPISPWIAAKGQIERYEAKWKTANTEAHDYLPYDPKTAGGLLVPPPQRNVAEPAIAAMVQALQIADMDVKAVTGIFDANLGERSSEESGRAILARQRQGDVANLNYQDNFAIALQRLGKILIDLYPRVYDVWKVVRITGNEDNKKSVMIHNGNLPKEINPDEKSTWPKGVEGIYNISAGAYDVTVSVGAAYETRRKEAVEAMLRLIEAVPELAPVIGPIMVKQMDWPGAQELAKVIKKVGPPELQDAEDGEEQIPPAIKQKLAQSDQQLQQLSQALDGAMQEIKTQQAKAQADIEKTRITNDVKLQIADMQEATKLMIAEMQAQNQALSANVSKMSESVGALMQRFDAMHSAQEAERQRQHDAEQANIERAHQAQQASQQQQADAQLQAQQPPTTAT